MAFGSFLRRSVAPVFLSTALAACSAGDGLAPSARFDDGDLVGAIEPVEPVGGRRIERQTAYSTPNPVSDAGLAIGNQQSLSDTAVVEPVTTTTAGQPVGRRRLPMIDSDEATTSGNGLDTAMGVQPLTVPEGGVNMDAGLGVASTGNRQPVVGLAQEQALEIAEGNASQPVVDGIGTDDPMQLASQDTGEAGLPESEVQQEIGGQSGWENASDTEQPRRRLPKIDEEQEVAFLPRAENPTIARQSTGEMPVSERSCRAELKRMGVIFTDLAPISKGATCGIPYPVELKGLSGGIGVKPAVKLNCQVTLAFAKWVKNELAPAARGRYWSGVKTVVPMGGYSCRRMNSGSRNPWSEHARGNAIDVGKFVLNNGKQIDVRKKGFFAFREKGLLKAVRSDSCKYFNTVLGPGSDPHHKDHFHFDLRSRKSGYRHCD
ncbi:extensin [Metarhizobium album]|uniref:Extensin n=1 Tax=Metarhizobium album TaxID=2182425 RepID=A0A2U2DTL1_9HYPH|nr:extensin family protein [Rhizobium album]PWE56650.1 extensin [Rhizobium album]